MFVKSFCFLFALTLLPTTVAILAVGVALLALCYSIMKDQIGRKDFIRYFFVEFFNTFLRLFSGQRDLKKILLDQNKETLLNTIEVNKKITDLVQSVEVIKSSVEEIKINQYLTIATIDGRIELDEKPMFISNPDGSLRSVNKAWRTYLEVDYAELVTGFKYACILSDRQLRTLEYQGLLKTPITTPYDDEIEFVTYKNRTIKRARVVTNIIKDKDDKILQVIGILTPII